MDNKAIQKLVDEAELLEDQGNVSKALECWRAILALDRSAMSLCLFGRIAMKAERWEEAQQAFLAAVDSDPELPCAYDYLGLWHRDRDDLEGALNYFNRSLEIKETAPTLTLLGAVLLKLGSVEAARGSFIKAINIDPRYEEAYYNFGLIVTNEQPTEAITLFRKAIEIDPEYADAHRELGWTLRIIDQYPEAEYHLRRSIELDSSDGWAYIYLGNLKWTTDDLVAAEQAFKKAIETWPDESLPYWCLALFYEYQDRTQEAESLYKKGLQLDPNDPEANLRFGTYLRDIGEYEKAKAYLERALRFDPNNERIEAILSEIQNKR